MKNTLLRKLQIGSLPVEETPHLYLSTVGIGMIFEFEESALMLHKIQQATLNEHTS
jgi:hypothetical protein